MRQRFIVVPEAGLADDS